MAKRGRPFMENPRNNRIEIRMNDKEAEQFKRICKSLGMNRSDAVRTLFENYEKNMK